MAKGCECVEVVGALVGVGSVSDKEIIQVVVQVYDAPFVCVCE